MARRPTKQGLSTGILIVLLAGVFVSQALQAVATHQPADKAAARGSTMAVVNPGTEVPILTATMKTSKPQDLIFSVSLECSIITQTYIPGGEDATSQSSNAEGTVRIWVEIDGIVVPINSSVSPPNDPSQPGDKAKDKVTFCHREQEHEVTDQEENEGPLTGGNPNGDGIDEQRLYLNSKTANAFNWIYMNAGSAVHTIVVKADLVTSDAACPAEGQPATAAECSQALIGNRTLTVFPERLANDAVV
jgi:hypothetical protein